MSIIYCLGCTTTVKSYSLVVAERATLASLRKKDRAWVGRLLDVLAELKSIGYFDRTLQGKLQADASNSELFNQLIAEGHNDQAFRSKQGSPP